MKLLLVDDHALFRAGMCYVLKELDANAEILEAHDCKSGINIAEKNIDLELILLDLDLPDTPGQICLKQLQHSLPATPIVVISAAEDSNTINSAVDMGAKGFIPKSASSEVMLHALNVILSGGEYLPLSVTGVKRITNKTDIHHLTPRQQEVLTLVAQGKSNKGIALDLGMSEGTVRIHVTAILKTLKAKSRFEAGYAAIKQGLVKDIWLN